MSKRQHILLICGAIAFVGCTEQVRHKTPQQQLFDRVLACTFSDKDAKDERDGLEWDTNVCINEAKTIADKDIAHAIKRVYTDKVLLSWIKDSDESYIRRTKGGEKCPDAVSEDMMHEDDIMKAKGLLPIGGWPEEKKRELEILTKYNIELHAGKYMGYADDKQYREAVKRELDDDVKAARKLLNE